MKLSLFLVCCFLLFQSHVYGENHPYESFGKVTPNTNGLNPYGSNKFDIPSYGITPNTNRLNQYGSDQFNNPFSGTGSNTNVNGINPYGSNQFDRPIHRTNPTTNGLNSYSDGQFNTTPVENYGNDTLYSASTNGNGGAFLGIIFWGVIIFFIFKFFSNRENNDSNFSNRENDDNDIPIRSEQPYLNVYCQKRNEPIPEQPGRTVELICVSIKGLAHFSHNNTNIVYRVRLIDVTDGEQNLQPIICYIPELSDVDGVFTFDVDAELPYASVTFDDIELVRIPTEALVAPKKGQRRIKVLVGITPPGSVEQFYIDGETTIGFNQQTYGWMEFQEAIADQESKLATLALCFASIGGSIGKAEATTIKKYFSELYAKAANADTRKQKVNNTMKETLSSLKNQQQQPREVIQRICDELFRENSPPLSQQAYEICVRVSVADDKLENSEEEMLSYISGKLQLAAEFVTEIHDRHITISTRQHSEDMSTFDILGMPKGLSKEQKLEWIQSQYRKWRNRVTNKDSKVSAEASLMLGMLSKARTQLTSES
ncbi:MAG: hypothetical protein DRQ57_09370 [Gammaproteobacteria bacterium]|nr:MAG: hypothetical protein DRQ57_09370 [Gammaproteobacteria bacterium]